MNQLDMFIADATRTESRIEAVEVNERMLTGVVQCMISLGNILDMQKKNTFYGKEIDFSAVAYHFAIAQDTMKSLGTMVPSEMEQTQRLPVNPRIFHAIIGTVTEGVELLEALDLYGEMDLVNLMEEFGDINWYQAIAFDEAGAKWQDILDMIIAKLKKRYPDKFTSEDAINRDLTTEREILEQGVGKSQE